MCVCVCVPLTSSNETFSSLGATGFGSTCTGGGADRGGVAGGKNWNRIDINIVIRYL